MKNLFFFLLLSATFSFVGCSDDDDEMLVDFMTATINGDSFSANSLIGLAEEDDFGEEFVFISGIQTSNSASIGLVIAPSLGTGTFQIGMNDLSFLFSDDINGPNAFFTEGTLTITTNDADANILEGTFEFTATDDADPLNVFNITNGGFRVTYE